jgi:hypothetical protein
MELEVARRLPASARLIANGQTRPGIYGCTRPVKSGSVMVIIVVIVAVVVVAMVAVVAMIRIPMVFATAPENTPGGGQQHGGAY